VLQPGVRFSKTVRREEAYKVPGVTEGRADQL
jgi:hypothetical protein